MGLGRNFMEGGEVDAMLLFGEWDKDRGGDWLYGGLQCNGLGEGVDECGDKCTNLEWGGGLLDVILRGRRSHLVSHFLIAAVKSSSFLLWSHQLSVYGCLAIVVISFTYLSWVTPYLDINLYQTFVVQNRVPRSAYGLTLGGTESGRERGRRGLGRERERRRKEGRKEGEGGEEVVERGEGKGKEKERRPEGKGKREEIANPRRKRE
ncbi:hypothetical protein Tco_0631077 [Tanacetum coccineum]